MYRDVCKNIEAAENFNKIEGNGNTNSNGNSYGEKDVNGNTNTNIYRSTELTNSNSNNNSNNSNGNNNSKSIADRNIESALMVLWKFLEVVPNGHGLPQGVSLGSLKPTQERNWDTLRPTAKR